MRIILADNSLVGHAGHSFEYAKSLREKFRSDGHEVEVWANARVTRDIALELDAKPVFFSGLDDVLCRGVSLRSYPGRLARRINFEMHRRRMRADLQRAASPGMTSDCVVIFHTLRHVQIAPILDWLGSHPKDRMPNVVLVFHFTAYPNFSQPSVTADQYTLGLSALANPDLASRVKLFADSTELIDEYRQYTDHPVKLLPIPHVVGEVPAGTPSNPTPDKLRVCYIGDARHNKGFHLLPELVRRINDKWPNKLVWEIQANLRDQSDTRMVLARNRLADQGVTLHPKELGSQAYGQLLNRADIVLLPYTLDYYHSQTSGIFSEAVGLGKVVVVSHGTWMFRQARALGIGAGFHPEDECDLFSALDSIVRDYPRFREKSEQARAAWNSQHNRNVYVDRIYESLQFKF